MAADNPVVSLSVVESLEPDSLMRVAVDLRMLSGFLRVEPVTFLDPATAVDTIVPLDHIPQVEPVVLEAKRLILD